MAWVAGTRGDQREFFFDHFTAPDAHFFWCFRRATQFELGVSSFKKMPGKAAISAIWAPRASNLSPASIAAADWRHFRATHIRGFSVDPTNI